MISLKTCEKMSDVYRPVTPWKVRFLDAWEPARHIIEMAPDMVVHEKGVHFGRVHHRYSVRIK